MIQPIGYLKLWRELFTKPIWLNSKLEQKVILVTLLGMANFKPNQWEWKGKKFEAQPGQFVTSASSIIANTGNVVTRQNVRTALARFEKLGFLTYESTKSGMLITIGNWGIYQGNGDKTNQDINQDLTNDQPRPNQDLTTIEEGKKGKREKRNIYTDEFEVFYRLYPNPSDKKRSFTNWNKAIKQHGVEAIMKSVKNYKIAMDKLNRDKQYMKTSANFLGKEEVYQDYLGTSKEDSRILQDTRFVNIDSQVWGNE